ncbi:MAG: hypothetical protein ACLQBJ_05585 [Bryobacteraceae bacterium]
MLKTASLLLLGTFIMNAEVRIEKTAYHGWPNCYRVSNGEIELIVTSDIGPRVMRLGFPGGQNFFWEEPATVGKSGEPAWVKRGGHRVWVGPEDLKFTYPPDNGPVDVRAQGGVLIATEPVEKETGIEKQIEIRMDSDGTGVTVIHRLRNAGIMPLEYAAWALTMMAQGGTAITGFPPRGTHEEYLQPTNPVVMWAYTDFSDSRWKFLTKYVTLRQDPSNANAQKLGTFNTKAWVAYALNGELFIKRASGDPAKTYPDFQCNLEMFTNNEFLEIETLGPITKVPAGAVVEHTERWSLHKNVHLSAISDAEIDRAVRPLVGH